MTARPENKSRKKTVNHTGCLSTDRVLSKILSKKVQDFAESDVNLLRLETFMTRNSILDNIIQKYFEDLYGTNEAPQDEFGQTYVREPSEKKKSIALNAFFTNLQKKFGSKKKNDKGNENDENNNDDGDELKEEEEIIDKKILLQPENEKFIWQGSGCDTCAQYNGQEFKLEDIPNTHPNCKCEVVSNQDSQIAIQPSFDYEKYHQKKEEEKTAKENNKEKIADMDQILLEKAKAHLKEEEGKRDYIYLDTKGIKTTGIGANIDTKTEFMKIDWKIDERSATQEEKLAAFNKMEELRNKGEFGEKVRAKHFEDKTNLKISEEKAEQMLEEHLKQDIKEIKKEVPEFDKLPIEMKEVLLDIKYNTGSVKDKSNDNTKDENNRKIWPKLHEAIRNKDIERAAEEVKRGDVSQSRNDWAKNKILSIKKW